MDVVVVEGVGHPFWGWVRIEWWGYAVVVWLGFLAGRCCCGVCGGLISSLVGVQVCAV